MATEVKDPKPYQDLKDFVYIKQPNQPNNYEYCGQVNKGGKKHGKGRLVFNVRHFYDGDFIDDLYDGFGILQTAEGYRYEGQFRKGKYEGYGTLYYDNISFYKGEFIEGMKDGTGTEAYPSGLVYTGKFKKDKPHGRGILVRGEYSYEGDFADGKKHGPGREYYKNSKYEGTFFEGTRHGKGVWSKNNGNSYKGGWEMGQKHGYGVEELIIGTIEKKGETYEGEFSQGYRHGFGRLTFSDGSFYYGNWQKGIRNGLFLRYNSISKESDIIRFDYGDEDKKPVESEIDPTDEQDGYRRVLEDTILRSEKVIDPVFPPDEKSFSIPESSSINPDKFEWIRISDMFKRDEFLFFSQEPLQIIPSEFSNPQLMTVIYGLIPFVHPKKLNKSKLHDHSVFLSQLFSPNYSNEYKIESLLNQVWAITS